MAENNDQWPAEPIEKFEFILNHPVHKYRFSTWFEVGPDKQLIGADIFYLVVKDECFDKLFDPRQPQPHSRDNPISLPNLNPKGFALIIRFVYTDKIESPSNVVDVSTLFVALRCAREIGYGDFELKCIALLVSKISEKNCIQFYARSKELCHQELVKISMEFIGKHIKTVFESAEFSENSEDDLCELLRCDNWFLDESIVFEAVRRWAIARVASSEAGSEMQPPGGGALRLAMGKAFHLIRFPLLNQSQFLQVWMNNEGLFECEEVVELLTFIRKNKLNYSPTIETIEGFITKQRQGDGESAELPNEMKKLNLGGVIELNPGNNSSSRWRRIIR